MPAKTILFVHGAGEGAHEEDMALANFVRDLAPRAEDVASPCIGGLENVSWEKSRTELSDALTTLADGGLIVAHSLGGAAVLKLLSETPAVARIGGLFLVATPYKVRDGEWGKDDFAIELDFADRLPDLGPIRLYHSRDDDFVPVDHAGRYGEKLPRAVVTILDGYGHQFSSKPFVELAADLKRTQSA